MHLRCACPCSFNFALRMVSTYLYRRRCHCQPEQSHDFQGDLIPSPVLTDTIVMRRSPRFSTYCTSLYLLSASITLWITCHWLLFHPAHPSTRAHGENWLILWLIEEALGTLGSSERAAATVRMMMSHLTGR